MATPTTRQLDNRLTDVEGALADERARREQQLAEIDEELHMHQEKLDGLIDDCAHILRRMSRIERRLERIERKGG